MSHGRWRGRESDEKEWEWQNEVAAVGRETQRMMMRTMMMIVLEKRK